MGDVARRAVETLALFTHRVTSRCISLVIRAAPAGEPLALILIDLPFPRQDGTQRLQQPAQAWPGVPVIALSSTFLPHVAAQGEVARQLGAAAVLPAPVAQGTLRAAVARLIRTR